MQQAILTTLIAGFCSVVGAVLAALINRYGWSFWRPATTLRCIGSATEMAAIRADGTLDDKHRGYAYDIRDGTLTIRGHRASLTALLTTSDGVTRVSDGRVKAQGRVHSGVAFLVYSVTEDHGRQAWSGTMVLRLPGLGNLTGYWITEDFVDPGVFAFGNVDLRRA